VGERLPVYRARFSEFLDANGEQTLMLAELWLAEFGRDSAAEAAQVQGQVCHQGLGQ